MNTRNSKTYNTWRAIIQRCNNPKATPYRWYGARGVSVCERWLSFSNFLADMGERPDGKSIERIDNDGNYEPSKPYRRMGTGIALARLFNVSPATISTIFTGRHWRVA